METTYDFYVPRRFSNSKAVSGPNQAGPESYICFGSRIFDFDDSSFGSRSNVTRKWVTQKMQQQVAGIQEQAYCNDT